MHDTLEATVGLNYKYMNRSGQLIVNTFLNGTHYVPQVNSTRSHRYNVPFFTTGFRISTCLSREI